MTSRRPTATSNGASPLDAAPSRYPPPESAHSPFSDAIGLRRPAAAALPGRRVAYPSVNGSRVPPLSSTHTDLVSRYPSSESVPFSRPRPEAL